MIRFMSYIFAAIIVSFYLFPFGLTFLPPAINTKNILALIGIPLLGYHLLGNRKLTISKELVGAIALATLFSLMCFFSIDYNHTDDASYATYIVSFFVWIFGAYAVCCTIRLVHGKATFQNLTYYLAAVCTIQCIFAILIDRIPAFQMLVDAYIFQDQDFLQEVNRLYGIGASLDNAGVRFAVVLVLISTLLVKNEEVRQSRWIMILLILAFYTIGVVGNMISRTTLVGLGIAFFYFIQATGIFRLVIKAEFLKFQIVFGLMFLLMVGIAVYFYNTDYQFREQIRFAFEGFFNWIEKGEWRTDSTDKLNATMWVWPTDIKTWLIGSGLFDDWVYGTDIGYCRFILYCGVMGFSIFALFFVYNAVVFGDANPGYQDLFFFLLILTFVIWVKVSTDIFTFYALFYCLDCFSEPKEVTVQRQSLAIPA